MDKVDWKVEGMTCSNCALSISKYLIKEGATEVKVNPIDGAVNFVAPQNASLPALKKGISSLGYEVVSDEHDPHHGHHHPSDNGWPRFLSNNKKRLLFCLPFTLVLMLHMLEGWVHLHWLMNPWVQLLLCLPVFVVGMIYFGKSAIGSIRSGVPNMNVLVTIGALAAFVYSLVGAVMQLGPTYLFFETSASIITLVLLGNYVEEASIQSTQRAVKSLAKSQKVMANMIAFDHEHKEQIFPIENTQLKTGDLVLIKNGETVPVDCKILWGEATVNEAIITGESMPLLKQKKDALIGGSVVESGLVKAQVTATGKDTVLSGILKMVQDAQGEKPPMQKLADKISAIFVPLVIGIAVLTFILNYAAFDKSLGTSLMRAIAVLVISCPCAMGLATPAAIAVGLGRAARNGILFRNASSLESFKTIRQVVFDKTGTLTTGNFAVTQFESNMQEAAFRNLLFSLEKYATHPIGKSIAQHWKDAGTAISFQKIEEIKGLGMQATDKEGNIYNAGSFAMMGEVKATPGHDVYLSKNNELLGWLDVGDDVRPEAKEVISWFKKHGIKTILLSGDSKEKCEKVAAGLGLDEVIAEQTPQQKMEKMAALNSQTPTAMVGDGINDAPALAKATLGISLSDATQIAMQSADVILMGHGLKNLPQALGLGKHTYITIKQNLFWAFLYNVVAIPVAAVGLLTPTVAALAMGLSDVVLAINSVRLFVKKVD